jgi:hypothetical protein
MNVANFWHIAPSSSYGNQRFERTYHFHLQCRKSAKQATNVQKVAGCLLDPVSETLYFLVFRIPDDGRRPEIQQFCANIASSFPFLIKMNPPLKIIRLYFIMSLYGFRLITVDTILGISGYISKTRHDLYPVGSLFLNHMPPLRSKLPAL